VRAVPEKQPVPEDEMSTKSRAKQTDRNRRYEKRTGGLPVNFLGDYVAKKGPHPSYVRAFGPGKLIKTSNPEISYRVGNDGAFRRVK
jgi:hypothetical protein